MIYIVIAAIIVFIVVLLISIKHNFLETLEINKYLAIGSTLIISLITAIAFAVCFCASTYEYKRLNNAINSNQKYLIASGIREWNKFVLEGKTNNWFYHFTGWDKANYISLEEETEILSNAK